MKTKQILFFLFLMNFIFLPSLWSAEARQAGQNQQMIATDKENLKQGGHTLKADRDQIRAHYQSRNRAALQNDRQKLITDRAHVKSDWDQAKSHVDTLKNQKRTPQ